MNVVMPVLIVLYKVVYVADHFTNCDWVLDDQCDGLSLSQPCGMDNVTYDNRRNFAKAYCRYQTFHVAHEGQCSGNGTGSEGITVKPNGTEMNPTTKSSLYTGSEAVLEFICIVLSHEMCTDANLKRRYAYAAIYILNSLVPANLMARFSCENTICAIIFSLGDETLDEFKRVTCKELQKDQYSPQSSVPFLVVYAADHFTNCNWVSHHQCDGFGLSQLCGMDGVTYDNRCEFAKAYCRDMSLHVANEGPCIGSGTGSNGATVKPSGTEINATTKPPLYTGTEAVLDFFCTLLSHEICTSTKDEICGSDNVTYTNPCEFEKERCSHRDLHVLKFGHC